MWAIREVRRDLAKKFDFNEGGVHSTAGLGGSRDRASLGTEHKHLG